MAAWEMDKAKSKAEALQRNGGREPLEIMLLPHSEIIKITIIIIVIDIIIYLGWGCGGITA